MTIGGVDINRGYIPYDTHANILQNHLKNDIKPFANVKVDSYTDLGIGYDNTWLIYYKRYYDDVPIVFNTANLTGGSTTPTITRTVLRNYSSNIEFDVVDYRFLSVPSDGPAVIVVTNDIPAACLTNCTYQFMDLLNLVNVTLNGSTLILSITNPTALNISTPQMNIKIGGIGCTVTSPSTTSNTYIQIICQL